MSALFFTKNLVVICPIKCTQFVGDSFLKRSRNDSIRKYVALSEFFQIVSRNTFPKELLTQQMPFKKRKRELPD